MKTEKENNSLINSENWLEKQKQLESKISASDFDNANKINIEYEKAKDNIRFEKKGFGIWFAFNCIAFAFLLLLGPFLRAYIFTVGFVILCVGLFPGMFIYILIRKVFPPDIYWIILLIFVFLGILLAR